MPNLDIFKKIAADPKNFVIDAPEKALASKSVQLQTAEKLVAFADQLDSLIEQYRVDLTREYYDDPDLDDGKDEWDEDDPINDNEASEIEFAGYRTQFMDTLKDAAILLNFDEGDITSAYGFDYNDIEDNFFIMRDDENFTDANAIQILEGIVEEVNATIKELKGETVDTAPPISKFVAENDDGTMYDDPSGP